VLDELAEDEPQVVAGPDDVLDEAEDLGGLLVEDDRREAPSACPGRSCPGWS